MCTWRKDWGTRQWAAFLSGKEIPVIERTRAALTEILSERGSSVSFRELSSFAMSDPFFALRLLRHAETIRSRGSLERETTTLLGAVMHLGVKGVLRDVVEARVCNESEGLLAAEQRASFAAHIAWAWACFRSDMSPDEVSMAALLSNVGELLLWECCPEMPATVSSAMAKGEFPRNREAQLSLCGFAFSDLSLALAEEWHLPHPVMSLMKGSDTLRAKLARRAVETARHVLSGTGLVAVPDDVRESKMLCPSANYNELLHPLGLSEESRLFVLESLAERT